MSTDIALRELFDLLESYSPVWYTEEQRNRAAAALMHSTEVRLRPGQASQESGSHRTHPASDGERNEPVGPAQIP